MRIALRRHRRHLLADGKRGRNRLMLLRRLHKEEPPRRTRRQLFPITLIHRSIYDKKRIVLRRKLPKQRERFNKLHTICFEPRFDFHTAIPPAHIFMRSFSANHDLGHIEQTSNRAALTGIEYEAGELTSLSPASGVSL